MSIQLNASSELLKRTSSKRKRKECSLRGCSGPSDENNDTAGSSPIPSVPSS